MMTVHATCIAFDGRAVLLRGPSGCGKSDLALRAIAGGAELVADDYVALEAKNGGVFASAPGTLSGMIEIRGLGLMRLEARTEAPVALVVDLTDPAAIERIPETRYCDLMGFRLPWLALAPFQASALPKLGFALMAADQPERLQP
jgi:serine kinase of HPr protein (carbohydrate metabolism regulator)